MDETKAIVRATGTVTYGEPAAAGADQPDRGYSSMETYWVLEDWIPPEHADSGKRTGYWTPLLDESGGAYGRFDVEEDAWDVILKIRKNGGKVRLVKVTREVVE